MEEITLNLIPTGVRPTCHVSQNDNERDIKINLVEGSLAYAIKSGDIVKLNIRKPNDVVISSRITATVGNTYVIANIKDEMCNVDGTNLCEIRITNGDTRISTSNFLMEVEVDPSANGGGGGGASNLADLDDVNISEPSNGQVLKYNGTSEMWENGTGGGGGASAMSDLTDVDLTGLEDGNSLVYDDDDDEWKVQTITKEVTQAEYDALVQAGTVDPKTAYFIKDTNGDGQDFQPVIYSDVEREIGVWRDGKPLYEKCIVLNNGTDIQVSNTGWTNTGVTFAGIDEFVDAFGIGNDGSYQGQILAYTDNNILMLQTPRNAVGWVAILCVRYTKSTDQAGSGTWTPQGVPAIHYSTDEKVVGTWVDGRTIYEKTLYSAGAVQGNFDITHNISNLDRVVNYSGTVNDTDPQWGVIWTIPRIASDGNNLGINFVNDTTVSVINPNAFGTRLVDWYITIQYVKSS